LFTIWLIFHVIVSIALVVVVLMQSSKGEGLAGTAFGGGGGGLSGAVFGGRGAASFLSKATTILAILFMLNSAALAFMSAGGRITRQAGAQNQLPSQTESVITREAQKERERQMQQQHQQQQQAQPSDSTLNINILPNEAKTKKGSAGK